MNRSFASVKTLQECFRDLSKENAKLIRDLVCGRVDPYDHDAGYVRFSECYHAPSREDMILHVLNALIDGYGVESCYPDKPELWYVNMGDPYVATIIYNDDTGKFRIGCWGDYFE